jgi:phenylalanyl-tRNA synthetase alpha chain
MKGHLHPMTQIIREIETIFREIGFEVAQGPELETEYFNFDALNIPADHPARDMQDTFWIKPQKGSKERPVLRTHTTSLTARTIAECKNQFPVRKIFPGKVFRNEATDVTHEAQFFQLDAVYVDKNVSLADLKGTLLYFYKRILGEDVEIRFRPSFFSFTEPSAEIDIKFKGKWLEMLGGGVIQQNVFKAAGVNPDEWSGFAFGGGIDRLLMVKYGIDDIRSLYSGDLRFVNQF